MRGTFEIARAVGGAVSFDGMVAIGSGRSMFDWALTRGALGFVLR